MKGSTPDIEKVYVSASTAGIESMLARNLEMFINDQHNCRIHDDLSSINNFSATVSLNTSQRA
jgi:hypothetical protein